MTAATAAIDRVILRGRVRAWADDTLAAVDPKRTDLLRRAVILAWGQIGTPVVSAQQIGALLGQPTTAITRVLTDLPGVIDLGSDWPLTGRSFRPTYLPREPR